MGGAPAGGTPGGEACEPAVAAEAAGAGRQASRKVPKATKPTVESTRFTPGRYHAVEIFASRAITRALVHG